MTETNMRRVYRLLLRNIFPDILTRISKWSLLYADWEDIYNRKINENSQNSEQEILFLQNTILLFQKRYEQNSIDLKNMMREVRTGVQEAWDQGHDSSQNPEMAVSFIFMINGGKELLQDTQNQVTQQEISSIENLEETPGIARDDDLNTLIRKGDLGAIKQLVVENTPKEPIALAQALYNTGNTAAWQHQKYQLAIDLYFVGFDVLAEYMQTLTEAQKRYPRSLWSSILNNIGTVYKRMRQWSAAISSYQDAYDINPEYVVALLRIALLHAFIGNQKEAKEFYDKYLNAGGTSDEAMRIIVTTDEVGTELKALIDQDKPF